MAKRPLSKEEIEFRRQDRKDTEQHIKDIKVAVGGFFVLVVSLVHYVLVMRQLLIHPDMSYLMMGVHFGLLAATVSGSCYLFVKFCYRKVYAEDIKEREKKKEE